MGCCGDGPFCGQWRYQSLFPSIDSSWASSLCTRFGGSADNWSGAKHASGGALQSRHRVATSSDMDQHGSSADVDRFALHVIAKMTPSDGKPRCELGPVAEG